MHLLSFQVNNILIDVCDVLILYRRCIDCWCCLIGWNYGHLIGRRIDNFVDNFISNIFSFNSLVPIIFDFVLAHIDNKVVRIDYLFGGP